MLNLVLPGWGNCSRLPKGEIRNSKDGQHPYWQFCVRGTDEAGPLVGRRGRGRREGRQNTPLTSKIARGIFTLTDSGMYDNQRI